VDLKLMPILISLLGAGLFVIPILVGGAMRLVPRTADLGRRVLVYASFSLLVGLACCWIWFGLLFLPFSLPFVPARFSGVLFSLWAAGVWASALIGIVLGATLAHRFLRERKSQTNGDGHEPPSAGGTGLFDPT
jgi:hypothetical protein